MAMIETIAVTKSGRRTKVTFRGLDAALSFEAEADDPGNVRVGLVHSLGGGVVISPVSRSLSTNTGYHPSVPTRIASPALPPPREGMEMLSAGDMPCISGTISSPRITTAGLTWGVPCS